MHLIKTEAALEAILFALGEPVEISLIANVLEIDTDTALKLTNSLKNKYISENRGMNIIIIENKVQMCTSKEYSEYIRKIVGNVQKKKELSMPMLETLAIIAYKQPVTKAEIQSIRGGINSDYAVNKLIEYELVEEKGRRDVVGKPVIFGTTDAFLTHFGFESINNLPHSAFQNNNDEQNKTN